MTSIKIYFFLLLFGSFQICLAQDNTGKQINGQIITNQTFEEGVHVMNLTKQKATITDANAEFSIFVSKGDTLFFSALQYKTKKLIITSQHLQEELLIIKLEEAINHLDEVVIRSHNLSGDISKDIKAIPTYENQLPLWSAADLKNALGYYSPDGQSNVTNNTLKNQNGFGGKITIPRLFKKKKMPKLISPTFSKVLKWFDKDFFLTELKIPESEFYNFWDYLNEETAVVRLIALEDPLKLLDFLTHHSKIYRNKLGIKS